VPFSCAYHVALKDEVCHRFYVCRNYVGYYADDAFRTLGDLLRWWLGRLISQGARGNTSGLGLSEGEDALMVRVLQSGDLNKLMDVWGKIGSLFDQAQSGNLDRKQTVLNSFLALEGALKR